MKSRSFLSGAAGRGLRGSMLFALLITSTGALMPVVAQEEDWGGARVVNILQEPRHRTVHRDGDLYVLDVQINPGDTTLPHTHDAAIMYTFISNGDGPIGGRVSGNTDYVTENYTHRVSNEGPNLFRIIAFANYGEPQSDVSGQRPTGLTGDPQLENPWFRSYRVELEPGEQTLLQMHEYPTLVVQVTDGLVHVSRNDGILAELDAMGDWAWRDANSPYAIRNAGTEPVAVVVNEGRR